MSCIFDYAAFSEEQAILFGNHFITIIAKNVNNSRCVPLLTV